MVMTRGKLIRSIDSNRIQEAIRQAEKRTSGEIRVSVSPLFWGDVRKAAEKAFERHGHDRDEGSQCGVVLRRAGTA